MASFPYDKSSLVEDFFFAWVFKNIAYYHKNPPNSSNTYEIPSNIEISKTLKNLKKNWSIEKKKDNPQFIKAMVKTIFLEYLLASLFILAGQTLVMVQAIIINYLVKYLVASDPPAYEGALLTIAFIIVIIIGACARSAGGYRTLILTGRIKNMIAIIISEKVLKLNNSLVTEESTRGKILNIISTDMELLELMAFTVFLWCIPFLIVFAIIIVAFLFGPVAIIGIVISALHIPFVFIIGEMNSKYRRRGNLIGDTRVKMIENLIEGIKIMKLYAWEVPFLKSIFNKRKAEISEKYKSTNLNGILQVFSIAGIALMLFITFYIQVITGGSLEPGPVFLVILIFFTTHVNVVYLTAAGINTIFVFQGIMKRAGEVLLLKEFDQRVEDFEGKYSLSLDNATFTWREDQEAPNETDRSTHNLKRSKSLYKDCLSGITLNVKKGELILVVGSVGCGKSSFLMSILGELNITSGSINKKGSVSYASEDAWILSGSIKDNILMGRPLDPELYTKTLNSCALIKDLALLNNGDESLVGDRGFTLSGGQRARLNLARCIYSNSDIILLDDPLSAVDSEVSNHIFQECIKGQLKGKTVILATHQVQFLSQADKILVLASGEKLFFGQYSKLIEREAIKDVLGDFAFRKAETTTKKIAIKEKKEENKEKINIEEEEVSESNVKLGSYIRYLKYGFKSIIIMILVLLVMCFSQVAFQAVLYWAAYWSGQADQESNYYIEGMGIIVLIAYIAISFRIYFLINLGLKANLELHNKALESVAMSPSVFFDKNPTGRIINRFSKDIGVIDGPLQYYLFEATSVSVMVIGNIIITIMIIPYNALAIPIWIVIYYFLFKYVSPIIIHLRKLELISRGPLLSTLNSALNGLPTIRSLNLQDKFKNDLKIHTNTHYRSYITFHTLLRFNQLYADLASIIIVALNVIILIAAKGFIQPTFAAYSLQSTSALLGLTSIWTKNILELSSNMSSAQRLLEYADIPSEGDLTSPENFKLKTGKIEFENIFMRYRPTLPYSLSGLSFTIKAGHKVGIIGRTGAGKSSVLQVLFRLVNPESGTIYLDGHDYMKMGLHELREQMSVIPQAAILFAASIRDNLDPFHLHEDKTILKVLDEVQLKELVLEHDDGLNAEVGGNGVSLSAGQKQLLCLARAILRENKIIMMDEATANVDNETDRLIQRTVKHKFIGCTLLVIAHRIRTIIKSDRIIVVDSGICKEYGAPIDLYNQEDSLFKNMIYHTGPEESKFLENKMIKSQAS